MAGFRLFFPPWLSQSAYPPRSAFSSAFIRRGAFHLDSINALRHELVTMRLVTASVGYEPARIQAKAGHPLKLAFFRADAQNCGRFVRFPALGLERQLPPVRPS